MDVLWAPWRMAYVTGPKTPGCIFCIAADTPERREHLVLVQRPAVVMLNRFPYAYGHLMVAPRTHAADFASLSSDQLSDVADVLHRTVTLLAEELQPQGFNVGINLGVAAGAGVADHLHWHIVPRWVGDANFMPLLAEVRVMPAHLESIYDRLLPVLGGSSA